MSEPSITSDGSHATRTISLSTWRRWPISLRYNGRRGTVRTSPSGLRYECLDIHRRQVKVTLYLPTPPKASY